MSDHSRMKVARPRGPRQDECLPTPGDSTYEISAADSYDCRLARGDRGAKSVDMVVRKHKKNGSLWFDSSTPIRDISSSVIFLSYA